MLRSVTTHAGGVNRQTGDLLCIALRRLLPASAVSPVVAAPVSSASADIAVDAGAAATSGAELAAAQTIGSEGADSPAKTARKASGEAESQPMQAADPATAE